MKPYAYFIKAIGEYGVVREIMDPIVTIVGLPHVKAREIVLFEKGTIGEVFTINKEDVEVLVYFSNNLTIGEQVVRTDETIRVSIGKGLLGKVIDPLGSIIYPMSDKTIEQETRAIDQKPLGISYRERITRPFFTGTSIVDLLIPLGKGQRELIIGDRKTGKSAFLLTAIKQQINEGAVVIYAAIAKKKSDIKGLQEFFDREGIMDKSIIVASDPHDSPSLIFLTPYTAMTIAEYFRDRGIDVLLIFDDLTSHAKFYREIALLGRRFPGRDSYPGDIFYVHAKLIERAGNFKHPKKGQASITLLPVVETIEGDLAGFIPTNIMGMTDGHIFFDSDAYYKGRRPAINISLSVTRVGRQTQSPLKRDITREITAFLISFEKMQSYAHFGAELSEKVKNIIKTGEKLQTFFNQHYTLTVPEEVQLILLAFVWLHHLDSIPDQKIDELRRKFVDLYEDKKFRRLLRDITNVEKFDELLLRVTKNKDEFIKLIM